MKFLLDTNMLLVPVQFKVDVYTALEEFGKPELFVLDVVLRELERRKEGAVALTILRAHPYTVLPATGHADDALLTYAQEGYTVCTLDVDLIRRLHAAHQKVVRMRNKATLILD